MHLTYSEKGLMVTTGIVGSSMPIATGIGWGAQIRGKQQVSVATFGDGAEAVARARSGDGPTLTDAMAEDDTVLIVECMPLYRTNGPCRVTGHRVPIAKAAILQEGTDITLVSYARTLKECQGAAGALAEVGISAEIIDLRSIQPGTRRRSWRRSPRPAAA